MLCRLGAAHSVQDTKLSIGANTTQNCGDDRQERKWTRPIVSYEKFTETTFTQNSSTLNSVDPLHLSTNKFGVAPGSSTLQLGHPGIVVLFLHRHKRQHRLTEEWYGR